MNIGKYMILCDVCGTSFQFGPHRYDGRKNLTYDIMVCNSCHNSNWDGWAPHYEAQVTKNLKAKGLSIPQRNERGWLPRG